MAKVYCVQSKARIVQSRAGDRDFMHNQNKRIDIVE